jgi:hypothetical protein
MKKSKKIFSSLYSKEKQRHFLLLYNRKMFLILNSGISGVVPA